MILDPINPRVLELLNVTEEQLLSMTLTEFVEAVHDRGYTLRASSVTEAVKEGGLTITVCTDIEVSP